jgi:hypothetical protein
MEEILETEYSEFNMEKFKQVLHYIIFQCGYSPNVGKTVLFKILYFTDFDYYELYEEKLTGEQYRKLQLGPAPVHFEEAIKELEDEGKIERFAIPSGTFLQQKFLPLESPSTELLNRKELQLIEDDIEVYSRMNARRISEFSHKDIPYKATLDGDIINYEKVFYRDSLFSVREYEEDD